MPDNKGIGTIFFDQRRSIGTQLIALGFVFIALLVPNRISEITPSAFASLPLEALLTGLSLLLPGRTGLSLRAFAAGLLSTGIIIKTADMAVYLVFDRPFNPVLDARFPADGIHLVIGTIGRVGAWFVAGLLLMLPIGIFLWVDAALKRIQILLRLSPKASATALLAALCAWTAGAFAGWHSTSTPLYNLMATHIDHALSSLADLEDFKETVDSDPYAGVTNEGLFNRLKGKDVLVIFVESYGRTVLDKAEYAAQIRPLLEQSGVKLAENGLFARSAYLTSPTYGGISWLAHGTLLSGLWINSQTRYDRLVMSTRPSLNRLFRRAGWRTVAVEPAHTMAWPQGQYFGYDRIYAAQDLGYRGQTFNWITMPDQYTLSAFQSLERKPGARPPVMAEIALVSSHAPWTPLPRLVDWSRVSDGVVFNQAREGDTPEAVWQNTERIREQYRKSIEYALATIVSYAITYGDENLVLLVLGDHQPAPFVTGDSPSRDVPVHLISRDSAVIAAADDWLWKDGMLPAENAPVLGMDKLRDRFITAFSKASEPFSAQ